MSVVQAAEGQTGGGVGWSGDALSAESATEMTECE